MSLQRISIMSFMLGVAIFSPQWPGMVPGERLSLSMMSMSQRGSQAL